MVSTLKYTSVKQKNCSSGKKKKKEHKDNQLSIHIKRRDHELPIVQAGCGHYSICKSLARAFISD